MFRHIEKCFDMSIDSFYGPFVHARLVIVSFLDIKYTLAYIVFWCWVYCQAVHGRQLVG